MIHRFPSGFELEGNPFRFSNGKGEQMKKFILLISAIGFFLIGLSSHAHANNLPAQNKKSNLHKENGFLIEHF